MTVLGAGGATTETLTNTTAAGRVLDSTVTAISADRKTSTITRDANGDTFADQSETRVFAADGASTVTITDLAREVRSRRHAKRRERNFMLAT